MSQLNKLTQEDWVDIQAQTSSFRNNKLKEFMAIGSIYETNKDFMNVLWRHYGNGF